jgi:hypothetical protein
MLGDLVQIRGGGADERSCAPGPAGQRAALLPGEHSCRLPPVAPRLQVKVVEPEALESNVTRFDPDVAICSRVTGAVMERVPVWVELYPEHAAHSVASEGGRRTEFAEIQLLDLISILDRAAGTD